MKKKLFHLLVMLTAFALAITLLKSSASPLFAQETVEITKTPVPIEKKEEQKKKKKKGNATKDNQSEQEDGTPRSKETEKKPKQPPFNVNQFIIGIGQDRAKREQSDSPFSKFGLFSIRGAVHYNHSNVISAKFDLSYEWLKRPSLLDSEVVHFTSNTVFDGGLLVRPTLTFLTFGAEVIHNRYFDKYTRKFGKVSEEIEDETKFRDLYVVAKIGAASPLSKSFVNLNFVGGAYLHEFEFLHTSSPNRSDVMPVLGSELNIFIGRAPSSKISLLLTLRYLQAKQDIYRLSGNPLREMKLAYVDTLLAIKAADILKIGFAATYSQQRLTYAYSTALRENIRLAMTFIFNIDQGGNLIGID